MLRRLLEENQELQFRLYEFEDQDDLYVLEGSEDDRHPDIRCRQLTSGDITVLLNDGLINPENISRLLRGIITKKVSEFLSEHTITDGICVLKTIQDHRVGLLELSCLDPTFSVSINTPEEISSGVTSILNRCSGIEFVEIYYAETIGLFNPVDVNGLRRIL